MQHRRVLRLLNQNASPKKFWERKRPEVTKRAKAISIGRKLETLLGKNGNRPRLNEGMKGSENREVAGSWEHSIQPWYSTNRKKFVTQLSDNSISKYGYRWSETATLQPLPPVVFHYFIIFIFSLLGSHVTKWKLMDDIKNSVGMTMKEAVVVSI